MTSCIGGLSMGCFLFVLLSICFFSFHIFSSDTFTTVQHRKFTFCIQVDNDTLYRGIENGPSPNCSSL